MYRNGFEIDKKVVIIVENKMASPSNRVDSLLEQPLSRLVGPGWLTEPFLTGADNHMWCPSPSHSPQRSWEGNTVSSPLDDGELTQYLKEAASSGSLSKWPPLPVSKMIKIPTLLPFVSPKYLELHHASVVRAETELAALEGELASATKRLYDYNTALAYLQGAGWKQPVNDPTYILLNDQVIAMNIAVGEARARLSGLV